MKLTSYEISKKLAQIGFDAPSHYAYFKDAGRFEITAGYAEGHSLEFKCYDFETIFDQLPQYVHDKKSPSYPEFLRVEHELMLYEHEFSSYVEFVVKRRKGESLADCAARLLIRLAKKKLIKFDKINHE